MSMICGLFVLNCFMSMIVRIFGLRLFHEHDSESIWSETL